MRNWLILAILAAALTNGLAPFADLWSAQDKQTKPTAPKPVSTAGRAKPTAVVKPAAAKPSPAEQTIFDSANRERAARQLPLLKWDAKLAAAARAHAQKMAQAGTLSHEFPGEAGMGMRIRLAGVNFTSVAENVAQGPSAAVLHQEWMNSPPHRSNILDPELDSLGVAVVERGGELFAVQDFALAAQ
jgi:uncharacterized protein YkwD